MCFGALTITNLGVENLSHYKKTILEIHSSEVRGHSLAGDSTGAQGEHGSTPWPGAEEGRGSNPLLSSRPGSGGWCPTSST